MGMADKTRKMTQQDKIERDRAIAERNARASRRKRLVATVLTVILCILLIFAFCFPAVTMLIPS